MGTITGSFKKGTQNKISADGSWASLDANTSDVGDALDISKMQNVSLQAVGTYTGSSVVTMQVSNDGTNWITAKDTAGSNLTFSANGLLNLGTKAKFLRPSIATGTGVVSIYVVAVG